jgi:hypothetical protein
MADEHRPRIKLIQIKSAIIFWLLAGLFFQHPLAAQTLTSNRYALFEKNGWWQLLHNGKPFYIKGAVGWKHFEILKECDANAVRTRATRKHLDHALKYSLAAMAGLPVRGERNGMDWDDPEMVTAQKRRIAAIVTQLEEHPALLFWAVGNELDWIPPGKPHNPDLWKHLNDLAVEIKKIDDSHPVLTVVGTGRFEKKIQQIAAQCPDFDLLGINSYGDIVKVTELANRYWPKPYLIAEWGPTGHWQAPKTPWGVPVEQTSTEKAQAIFERYTNAILPNRNSCLGSFVFLWGQKQETTHTWYGMFRDGLQTESVDVMKYLWSCSWPQNRTPAVLNLSIDGFADKKQIYLEPAKTYSAKITCYDSDYDELSFKWDVRPEVIIPENSYAGGLERPAIPIRGLIKDTRGSRATFMTPDSEGSYRLFVEVYDSHDHAGYANVPFYVRSEQNR